MRPRTLDTGRATKKGEARGCKWDDMCTTSFHEAVSAAVDGSDSVGGGADVDGSSLMSSLP